jgi:hypothetical protein
MGAAVSHARTATGPVSRGLGKRVAVCGSFASSGRIEDYEAFDKGGSGQNGWLCLFILPLRNSSALRGAECGLSKRIGV